ncbi:MAG TPA: hypothetical protein VHY35_09930 [Stellaceae bacterium]|jgi:hypothetical protein|nr:hypothetical protein [Stellaceae bacterium]
MRGWLIVVASIGLSGCIDIQGYPPGYPDSGWRTRAGAPISLAEYDALRESCVPRRRTLPMDSDQPLPDTMRDNPAYHPGGEGLANAPMTGIVAIDREIEPGTRRSAEFAGTGLEDCLEQKGLSRVSSGT